MRLALMGDKRRYSDGGSSSRVLFHLGGECSGLARKKDGLWLWSNSFRRINLWKYDVVIEWGARYGPGVLHFRPRATASTSTAPPSNTRSAAVAPKDAA